MELERSSHIDGETQAALPAAQDALKIVVERILEWPIEVREARVTPVLSTDTLERRIAAYDLSQSHRLDALVAGVVDLLEGGGLHSTHPRYFGLFVPGVRRAGVIADALAALYNPQVAAWWHAPAASEIERHTLAHLSRRLGAMPPDATAMFTTGGSEANLTGVLLAGISVPGLPA
jgi:glutamate/tyrosine decarboxylase-like PLP-dependent enzyme